jgi:hypothetical protein
MVARPIFDRLEQREDLAFAQDPLGEFLLEGGPLIAAPALKASTPSESRTTAAI